MPRSLVIDIETTPRPGIMDTWYPQWASVKYPGKEGTDLEDMAALHAEFGMICAVAFASASSDDEPTVYTAGSVEEEQTLLENLQGFLSHNGLMLIGHNIKGFDIPFMAKRFMAHSMVVPASLNVAGMKPWEILHKDTMEMMQFGKGVSMSLRSACLLLGLDDPKGNCCGSEVPEMFRNGEIEKIGKYCAGDVISERALYNKIISCLG